MSFLIHCIGNVNYLLQEELFTDGGRQAELQDIQDVLDRGGKELPGTVFSVAAALLTFLSALAEPVVPTSLHAKAMDGNNNLTLCKQVRAWCSIYHLHSKLSLSLSLSLSHRCLYRCHLYTREHFGFLSLS